MAICYNSNRKLTHVVIRAESFISRHFQPPVKQPVEQPSQEVSTGYCCWRGAEHVDLVRSENVGMVGTVSARALVSQKRIGQGTFLQYHFGLAFMEKSYLVGTALI